MAVAVPGKAMTLLSVAVNITLVDTVLGLVALKLPLTLSPGPAQASGSTSEGVTNVMGRIGASVD